MLQRAEQEFAVIVTMDRGVPYQQDPQSYELGIVLLAASSNQYEDLLPLMPLINEAVERVQAGEVLRVEEGGITPH